MTDGVAKKITKKLDGYHILLAEDSPDQQRLFATLLQRAGARVTLECNGESAVEQVMGGKEDFDAVVLDFMMPVMDGVEATRQLRDNGFTKPIVAITAHGNQITEKEWLSAGADVFLLKPLGPTEFISAVQSVF